MTYRERCERVAKALGLEGVVSASPQKDWTELGFTAWSNKPVQYAKIPHAVMERVEELLAGQRQCQCSHDD